MKVFGDWGMMGLGFGKSLIQPVFFHTHFEIDTMKAIMVQR
jgi:hypothetical protein